MRTVLMVAEKPSLAQSIAKILSRGTGGGAGAGAAAGPERGAVPGCCQCVRLSNALGSAPLLSGASWQRCLRTGSENNGMSHLVLMLSMGRCLFNPRIEESGFHILCSS